MNKVAKGIVGVLGITVLGAAGTYVWAQGAAAARIAVVHETHRIDIPAPWPLSEEDKAQLRIERTPDAVLTNVAPGDGATPANPDALVPDPLEGVDLGVIATERAAARGKHLIESRFVCVECHGKDFGGGVMVEDPAMGSIHGPNITTGKGSRTLGYTMSDWDRIVRHGVKPDGTSGVMPSADFLAMSDQELSDVVTYIRTQPAVDATIPAPTFGPIGTMLVATGKMELASELLVDHNKAHPVLPPAAEANAEYGAHLAQVCTGCHRADLSGGPISAGPPSWPPARNLTPDATGLEGWSYDQFRVALLEAKRPDGTPLKEPMTLIPQYAKNMTDTEMQALWAYLQAVPAKPTGS